jgi:hypothetical protein
MCPKNHPFEKLSSLPEYYDGEAACCDECMATCDKEFMHCKICEYDLCMNCYSGNKPLF